MVLVITVGSESSKEKQIDTNLWVVDDFDSLSGLQLASEALSSLVSL